MTLKVFDTFSGIGGFSLGLESTGFYKTVAFCEQDSFCQKILKKHWPEVPIFNDIKGVENDFADVPEFDVLTGGVPCQPFSEANVKKKGTADDRHLWPSMFKIITRKRPSVVIVENVTGFIPLFLDQLLIDLENENYSARPFVLPALGFDAPHRRDRIWVVAYATGQRHSRRSSERSAEKKRQIQQDQQERSSLGSKIKGCGGVRGKKESTSNERLSLSKFCRMDDGLPNWMDEPKNRITNETDNRRDRIKALGNSILPQIAAHLGEAIYKSLGETW